MTSMVAFSRSSRAAKVVLIFALVAGYGSCAEKSVSDSQGTNVKKPFVTAKTVGFSVGTDNATVTVGNPHTYFVNAIDGSGNVTTNYKGTVQIILSDPAGEAPSEIILTGGVATFSVTFTVDGMQSVTATDIVNPGIMGRTGILYVAQAVTASFLVTTPEDVDNGAPFNITITAVDAVGNKVPTNNDLITFTSTDGGAVLPPYAGMTNGVCIVEVRMNSDGLQTISASDSNIDDTIVTGTSVGFRVGKGTVFFSPPMAFPNPGIADIPVTYTASTLPTDAVITWDFGDGSPQATGDSVQHIFAVPGTYTTTASAVDSDGGKSASQTITVTINDIQPKHSTFFPGTVELIVKQGTINKHPGYLRISGTATFPKGTSFDTASITVAANGFSESFTLTHAGSFSGRTAKLAFKSVASKPGTVNYSIYIHSDDLGQAASTDVGLDDQGRPTKVLIQLKIGKSVASYLASLQYPKAASSVKATFGQR